MFDFFFGWRKASKCKKLLKRVRCRLKLLKNKRFTIVKQLREDMAQLIKLGYQDTAFNRAEQLSKDENIMAVYDILDNFCEFINIQLSYIRKHKDCPNDINEAISSLIFSSARCADLPELTSIRKLFGERYGHRFATAAVELLPGNLVNRELREKLSVQSVSDDVKYRLIDEIARDYLPQPEILALEYFPEWKSSQMQASDGSEMEGKFIRVDQSIADSPRLSSSESLPRFSKEVVVYLDDIEELQSSLTKEVDSQDQRLFKFKSRSLPTRRVMVVDGTDGDDESYTDSDDGENEDDKQIPNRNKSRWRSFSSMKDVDHETYYDNRNHKSWSKESSYVAVKRPKQPCDYHVKEETCSPRNKTISDVKGISQTRKETVSPYLRATTMQQERPREIHRYTIVRSSSLPMHNPNHVHPKLPEYEDIATKFMALKKDILLQNQC